MGRGRRFSTTGSADGYDNGLPAHVPANPSMGSDPAMAALVGGAQAGGIEMALHENYVDYYPNFRGVHRHGHRPRPGWDARRHAWYNPGTKSSVVRRQAVAHPAVGHEPRGQKWSGATAARRVTWMCIPPCRPGSMWTSRPDNPAPGSLARPSGTRTGRCGPMSAACTTARSSARATTTGIGAGIWTA